MFHIEINGKPACVSKEMIKLYEKYRHFIPEAKRNQDPDFKKKFARIRNAVFSRCTHGSQGAAEVVASYIKAALSDDVVIEVKPGKCIVIIA